MKLKKDDKEIITTNTGPTYFLEEDISIDEKYVKNKSLVRMDMNIVQFPIFSKNTKRKKNEITTYYFNKNRDTYITIKPSAGDLIPGEAEERIFIALMKLMREKDMAQEFIVTAREIKDAAKINASNYITDIKKSLLRLSESNYNFKNTMYSNEINSIIRDEVSTPILTFKARQLSLKENSELKSKINDARIKEVYQIKISDHFYKNIIKRGYLVYDSNILLDIHSGVARTLYMLLEKIRFNRLYIKESIFALIKKIPLKYEKRSLPITIKTLERSFKELEEKNLIASYRFIKPTTWLEADVEIFFNETHNDIKQERFEDDNKELKHIYSTLAISFTEKKKTIVTEAMIDEIFNFLPRPARNLKTMPSTVKECIEAYGYERTAIVARYIKKNKVEKIRAYFLKALKENWIIEEHEIPSPPLSPILEEPPKDYSNFEKFEKLPLGEQEKIEKEVYKTYISQCGAETKIQKNAYRLARKSLISEYLNSHKALEDTTEVQTESKHKTEIDPRFLKEYLNRSIEMYKTILDLSEEQILEIKKEVSIEIIPKILKNSIELEEIDQILAEKIKH